MEKRIHEVVHTLRQKPEHVRENIALGVSGGITLVVALGWMVATVASGSFSLTPSATLASAGGNDMKQAMTSSKDSFSQLLGAAGAAVGATSTAPATITIVDTEVHSTLDQPTVASDETVIHF